MKPIWHTRSMPSEIDFNNNHRMEIIIGLKSFALSTLWSWTDIPWPLSPSFVVCLRCRRCPSLAGWVNETNWKCKHFAPNKSNRCERVGKQFTNMTHFKHYKLPNERTTQDLCSVIRTSLKFVCLSSFFRREIWNFFARKCSIRECHLVDANSNATCCGLISSK